MGQIIHVVIPFALSVPPINLLLWSNILYLLCSRLVPSKYDLEEHKIILLFYFMV